MESDPQPNPFELPPASGNDLAPGSAELERDQQRLRYQLCRLGFAVQSFALLLACFSSLVVLLWMFGGHGIVAWVRGSRWWYWLDVPIVWGSLAGAYLFWGRWSHPGWQRRAGLLLIMSLVDAGLWLLDHANDLGLHEPVAHEWLRNQLGQALGWAEFMLIASLSCDFMAHLGVEQAPEAGKATRSLSATGAVVWMILFVERTAWNKGWPLQDQGIRSMEALLLSMGTHMMWTITLIQATALTIGATRQASRVLAEMDLEDQKFDQLPSPFGISPRGRDDEFSSRANEGPR